MRVTPHPGPGLDRLERPHAPPSWLGIACFALVNFDCQQRCFQPFDEMTFHVTYIQLAVPHVNGRRVSPIELVV